MRLQPGGFGWVWLCWSSPGLSSTLPAGSAMRTSAVSLLHSLPPTCILQLLLPTSTLAGLQVALPEVA